MSYARPLNFPILCQNEVHLWLVTFAQLQQKLAGLWDILNAEERQRADRIVIIQHSERFIMARGVLRQLLASYLNCSAYKVKFAQGVFGKIEIDRYMPTRKIKFNISHADEYALFAFSLDRDVGVDIERIRPGLKSEAIAQRFFSPIEVTALLSLPHEMRLQAFFNCWTRKEAFIKAIGRGLYYPLHEFDVDIKTSGEAKLELNIHDAMLQNTLWNLFSLEAVAGYVAALVAEGNLEQENIRKFKYEAN